MNNNESLQDQSLISTTTNWVNARANENSTALGAALLATASPSLADNLTNVITMSASGNVVGAVTNAIPLLITVITVIKAIITPDSQGPTNEQIKTAVSTMSRDELIQLLTPKAPVPTGTRIP